MTQCGGQECARENRNLTGDCIDGLPTDCIRFENPQFGNLLDDDQTIAHRYMVEARFHERRLA